MTQTNNNNQKVKSLRFLGVDTGFGDVKVHYDDGNGRKETLKFGTNITRGIGAESTLSDNDFIHQIKPHVWQGQSYYLNSNLGTPVYTRDTKFIVENAPLLIAEAMVKLGITFEDVDVLAVGLPLNDMPLYKDELSTRLKIFTINGIENSFKKIYVIPQAFGGFVDHISTNQVLFDESGCILDIGFNTIIYAPYQGSKFIGGVTTQSDKEGISTIIYKVKDIVSSRYSVTVGLNEIKNAFFTNQNIFIRGEKVDLTSDFKTQTQNYIEDTLNKLFDNNNFNNTKVVYLIGGGAYYLKDRIPPKYKNLFAIAHNPEYANVRGYVLYAQDKESKTS